MTIFYNLFLATLFVFLSVPAFASKVDAEISAEKTPVVLDALASHRGIAGSRSWRAPTFEGQIGALGWADDAFSTPKGLESNVDFWIKIYTKYSTQQGVIHDSEDIGRIFEEIDFSAIENSGLPGRVRERMKKKTVEDAKERALATLPKGFEASRLRFQLGQKDRMETAIYLSGRYLEEFEQIFQEAGLPIELTRLVFVESSFNVLARSKVGASGLWQIMPGTARPYRVMNAAVDGRNHPLTATRLAAKILAGNYRKLQSWPLAVTGYNHGPAGMGRLAEKYGTRELGKLVSDVRSSKNFGFASRNFYASFLAAKHVEQNAAKYFPSVNWSKKFDGEELKLPQDIKFADLADWFDGDQRRLQVFNPHLTSKVRRGFAIPKGTLVLIPSKKYDQALVRLGQKARYGASKPSVEENQQKETVQSEKASQGRPQRTPAQVHKVARGQTMTTIAREYDVRLNDLLRENDFKMNDTLRAGQRIRIPR